MFWLFLVVQTIQALTLEEFQLVTLQVDEWLTADADNIPKAVRLAFHDCIGGCNGCINRLDPNNAGVDLTVEALEPLYSNVSGFLSRADFWVLVGKQAVIAGAKRQSPSSFYFPPNLLTFRTGRNTCPGSPWSNTLVDLPDAQGNLSETKRVFVDGVGLTLQQTVALLGAHTLGQAKATQSGFQGLWTLRSRTLDNEFYIRLTDPVLNYTMNTVQSSGKLQWNSDPEAYQNQFVLMMLNTDIALWKQVPTASLSGCNLWDCPDSETAAMVQQYAHNNSLWMDDFVDAYNVLTDNTRRTLTVVSNCPSDCLTSHWLDHTYVNVSISPCPDGSPNVCEDPCDHPDLPACSCTSCSCIADQCRDPCVATFKDLDGNYYPECEWVIPDASPSASPATPSSSASISPPNLSESSTPSASSSYPSNALSDSTTPSISSTPTSSTSGSLSAPSISSTPTPSTLTSSSASSGLSNSIAPSISSTPTPSPSTSSSTSGGLSDSTAPSISSSTSNGLSESIAPSISASSSALSGLSDSTTPSISSSTSGGLSESIAPSTSASSSTSGGLSESTTPSISASSSTSGGLSESIATSISASSSTSGGLSESTTPSISASSSTSGGLSESIATSISASSSTSGGLSESTTPSISASSSTSGGLSESIATSISASSSTSGGLSESTTPSISASSSTSGGLSESIATSISASSSTSGGLSESIAPSTSSSTPGGLSESIAPSISSSTSGGLSESIAPSTSSPTPSTLTSSSTSASYSASSGVSDSSAPSTSSTPTPSTSSSRSTKASVTGSASPISKDNPIDTPRDYQGNSFRITNSTGPLDIATRGDELVLYTAEIINTTLVVQIEIQSQAKGQLLSRRDMSEFRIAIPVQTEIVDVFGGGLLVCSVTLSTPSGAAVASMGPISPFHPVTNSSDCVVTLDTWICIQTQSTRMGGLSSIKWEGQVLGIAQFPNSATNGSVVSATSNKTGAVDIYSMNNGLYPLSSLVPVGPSRRLLSFASYPSFGHAVAVGESDGLVLIVSAPLSNSVFVFRGNISDETLVQTLVQTLESDCQFGFALAAKDDLLAVSSVCDERGLVRIYRWEEEYTDVEVLEGGDGFGHQLLFPGELLVVQCANSKLTVHNYTDFELCNTQTFEFDSCPDVEVTADGTLSVGGDGIESESKCKEDKKGQVVIVYVSAAIAALVVFVLLYGVQKYHERKTKYTPLSNTET